MEYYVYMYLDPRKNPLQPIYIGKGKGNRAYDHLKKCKNPILDRKIKKIRKQKLKPIIIFLKRNISDSCACTIEKYFIKKYGRIDNKTGILCNLTNGGEGTSGRICKEETKKIFSLQRKGKKQTELQYKANCSRRPSKETRLKISKAQRGINRHTEYSIRKIKENNYKRGNVFNVVLPCGKTTTIKNLSKFCREHKLDRTTATKSATSGKPYKGYSFSRIIINISAKHLNT